MGILRGIARWFVKFLLVISIAAFIIASTLAYFSTAENLLPIAQEVAMSQISDSQINEFYTGLDAQCKQQNKEIIIIQSPIEGGTSTITVNCTRLKEGKQDEVKTIFGEQVIGGMLQNASSSNCNGIDCISRGPLGFISQSFHSLLKSFEIISIIAMIIFGILVFLLSEGISSKLINLGSPFLFTGLGYFLIPAMKNNILAGMQNSAVASKIADILFIYLSSRFLAMMLIGAALIIAGIIFKFIRKKEPKKGGKKK